MGPAVMAAILVAIFAGGSLAARRAGLWHSGVPARTYLVSMVDQGMVPPEVVRKTMRAMMHRQQPTAGKMDRPSGHAPKGRSGLIHRQFDGGS